MTMNYRLIANACTDTQLSGPEILRLTRKLSPNAGRVSTKEKAVGRFSRLLAEQIGEDRAAACLTNILCAPGRETAEGRLIAEIEAAEAAAQTEAHDPQTEAEAAAMGLLDGRPEDDPAPAGNAQGATFEGAEADRARLASTLREAITDAEAPATGTPAAQGIAAAKAEDAEAAAAFHAEDARKLAEQLERRELRYSEKRVMQIAAAGIMPPAPDFSAETHARFRQRLADLIDLAEAGNIEGLRGTEIKVYCSSTRPLDLFRRAAIRALEAQQAEG